MTPEGERIGPVAGIDSDPFELAAQVASWGEAPEVVLEATYGWYWAADVLAEHGARVHLAHPLGVKGFAYRRAKNDERDAADLADLLRMGRLPEAWVAPPAVRALRETFRRPEQLCSWAGMTPRHGSRTPRCTAVGLPSRATTWSAGPRSRRSRESASST
jgi:transposase